MNNKAEQFKDSLLHIQYNLIYNNTPAMNHVIVELIMFGFGCQGVEL